jgi:tetratricopeptide (TPR) repeat protein
MKIRCVLVFLFFLQSLLADMLPDLIKAPISPPITEKPVKEENSRIEKRIYYLEKQSHLNAQYSYELALFYIQDGQMDKAKRRLNDAIVEDPKFYQAYVQLGFIALWEEDVKEAKRYFEYAAKLAPSDKAALYGMSLTKEQMLSKKARRIEELDEYRRHPRSLVIDRQYKQAKKEYAALLKDHPYDQKLNAEMFEVRSHTDFCAFLDTSYTDAKENDPTLQEPVVKDYYFASNLNILIPVFDTWRLDAKGIFFHQRENNILNSFVNYNAFIGGGQLLSHYYFANDWRWDVTLREIRAWGSQTAQFPFLATNRFEPGTCVVYSGNNHFFIIDGHIESFIIKNFAAQNAELLRTDHIDTSYLYRPEVFLNPKVGVALDEAFYQDHNRKDWQSLFGSLDLGVPMLTLTSLFEHSHFKFLTSNYFSYNQQIRETIGLKFHTPNDFHLYFEVLWEHSWQWTHNLIMPIGDLLFIAQQQYIIGNLFSSRLVYRFRDRFKFELGGHYLRTTLIYRDWNLNGALRYQF